MKRLSASSRDQAIVAVVASGSAIAVLAWAVGASSGLAKLNDFYREAAPAYTALIHGHVSLFLQRAPAYGGSLILRAPFAMLPGLWGGGSRALFFWSALPCILAMVAFCVWLAPQPRRHGITWGTRFAPVACCAFSPVIIVALFGGHPEEILGAVLCVAAVALASAGRAEWAGVIAGLAVANKPWALVALPVVVAALPERRIRALIAAGATATLVLAPIFATRDHGVSAVANGSAVGGLFNPPQLLWWLGPRAWIVQEARPLMVMLSIALAVTWRLRRAATRSTTSTIQEALLLLTLVLLLRAALDPWNNLYYHVPFLFALMALEIRTGRTPIATVVYMFALLFVVPIAGPIPMSYDLRAAVYAALVLPTIAWLTASLYAPRRAAFELRMRKRRVTASAMPAAPIAD